MTRGLFERIGFTVVIMSLAFCCGGCGNSTSTPGAPTGLSVQGTALNVTLTWNAESGCVYNIYRGTASGMETAIAGSYTNSFTDPTPAPSTTTYYYFVTALNSDAKESGASNEVSVTVTSPTLVLGTVTQTSVLLSWTAPSSITGITGYNIYRSTTAGAEAAPATYTSTVANYTDTSVVHGTTYYYRVTAVGANGETIGSNEITATP